jgi:hypothetical protein
VSLKTSRSGSKLPLVIFTLTSARSGTLYLRSLFQKNVRDCLCRHEPFFDWGNPTMFGPAIYDAYAGRLDLLRARLVKKRDYILRRGASAYLESSHAFLKSAYLVAPEIFPDMRLIHLIRNPLMVAQSEAVREQRRAHAPFHYYRGDDGRRHFCWSLTMKEEIYRHFDVSRLSLFQKYLLQWIEIENRAMAFLERHGWHDRCFVVDSPRGLNDAATVKNMFDFFGLSPCREEIVLAGRRNASLGHATVIRPDDEREFDEVASALPDRYLEIFQREPYAGLSWSGPLRRTRREPQRALENAT